MSKWKAVRLNVSKNPKGPLELYDLERDLGETTDVAAQHPDIVKKMAAIIDVAHKPPQPPAPRDRKRPTK